MIRERFSDRSLWRTDEAVWCNSKSWSSHMFRLNLYFLNEALKFTSLSKDWLVPMTNYSALLCSVSWLLKCSLSIIITWLTTSSCTKMMLFSVLYFKHNKSDFLIFPIRFNFTHRIFCWLNLNRTVKMFQSASHFYE